MLRAGEDHRAFTGGARGFAAVGHRPWKLQLGPDPSWEYPLQPVDACLGVKKTRCRGRAYAAGAPAAGSHILINNPRFLI